MDFNNLTFDELLDAIRSDSGYQTAQAKKERDKIKLTKEAAPEPVEVATEEITLETEYHTEENVPADEPEPTTFADYYGEEFRFTDSAPTFSPIEELFANTDTNDADEEEEPAPVFSPISELFSSTDISDIEEKSDDNHESLSELPDIKGLFEIVEDADEEPAIWENPASSNSFYVPITLEDESPNDGITEPLQIITPDIEEEKLITSEPDNQPIELISTEKEEENESEQTEESPSEEEDYAYLYGFSFDTKTKALFEIEPENDIQPPPVNYANDKTRVVAPPVPNRTEAGEKTRIINEPTPPAADSKTRTINYSPLYERPGIVTTSSEYDKTADLNAMPHILPADEFIDKEPKKFHRTGEIPKVQSQPKTPVVRHDTEDEQMVLPGFFELEEVVRVSESEVEEELRRTRSRKVNSFKLEGADIDGPVMDEEVSRELKQGNTDLKHRRFSRTKTRHRLSNHRVEFSRPSDGRAVHGFISSKKLVALIGTIVSAVCAIAMIITTAVPFVADKINSRSAGTPITYILSLVFLIVAAAAAIPSCVSGITCFFTGAGKPNAQTPVIIATLVALIQNIIAITTYNDTVYPLFSLAAVFLLCCCSVGNMLIYQRTLSNFAFLFKQGKEGLYSVRAIDNALDANRVSQNVVMGDAEIRYSGKLKFATRFISYSLSSNSTDDLCAKLVPISLAVSAVIGVIAGIMTKSFMGGITLFSGALCMGSPVCALIAANLPLLIENKRMNADGAMITSYAAAYEYESTNAIALDASDLFPGENCNIHGMKTFNGLRVDDAVLTAASMLIAAGGPTSSLFKNVIMEHSELLLKVEDLKYEERLGLSGWIRDRRIFVGNRKLLENHNIEIPMSVDESKYARGDRQIIYLADAGKIAAFFVVSYGRNKKIAEYLRRIESNGINILVRTTDSNINEKFISKCFDIPLNSVKVVSNTAGEVLKNYSEHIKPREDAKLIHNGTATGFLHAVSSAGKLCATAGKISALQTSCMIAGLLLTLLVMIFSGPLSLTALSVCLCQALWMAIAAILPLFGRE